MKGIMNKIIFESKMLIMDMLWKVSRNRQKGKYPPSFFQRNTPDRIKKILAEEKQKELEELREIAERLNNYRKSHGLPEKDYKKEWAL